MSQENVELVRSLMPAPGVDLARIVRSHAISDPSLVPVLDETLALTDQSLQEFARTRAVHHNNRTIRKHRTTRHALA